MNLEKDNFTMINLFSIYCFNLIFMKNPDLFKSALAWVALCGAWLVPVQAQAHEDWEKVLSCNQPAGCEEVVDIDFAWRFHFIKRISMHCRNKAWQIITFRSNKFWWHGAGYDPDMVIYSKDKKDKLRCKYDKPPLIFKK